MEAGAYPTDHAGGDWSALGETEKEEGGAPDDKIMAQTNHRSLTTLLRYKRDADLFNNNAASFLGL